MTGSVGYAPQTAYDIKIESVVIYTDRLGDEQYDITNVVEQINIFEHLDKPFLTGDIFLMDFSTLMDDIDFQGTEYVEFTIGLPDQTQTVTKTFLIENLERSIKNNDQSEGILLNIVEKEGYKNYMITINQSFVNKRSDEMIETIVTNYFNRDIDVLSDPSTLQPFTATIPHWHPFEATTWLVNRTVKGFGIPYFFYSSLVNENFILDDLGKMVSADIQNPTSPYLYSQSEASEAGGTGDVARQSYVIDGYTVSDIEDNLALIRKGFVGATFNSFNNMADVVVKDKFSFSSLDLFQRMVSEGIVPPDEWLPLDTDFKMDGVAQTDYRPNKVFEVLASDTYYPHKSYQDAGQLSLAVRAAAARAWLGKNNIQLSVPGRNFLPGTSNNFTKIGDKINVTILTNKQSVQNVGITEDDITDKKRSGEYIIYAAKHTFQPRRYSVSLDCFKLSTTAGTTQVASG